jgi:hypothetical protein
MLNAKQGVIDVDERLVVFLIEKSFSWVHISGLSEGLAASPLPTRHAFLNRELPKSPHREATNASAISSTNC